DEEVADTEVHPAHHAYPYYPDHLVAGDRRVNAEGDRDPDRQIHDGGGRAVAIDERRERRSTGDAAGRDDRRGYGRADQQDGILLWRRNDTRRELPGDGSVRRRNLYTAAWT